jgi:4-amino-4-deoxychorismate lyase
VESALRQGAGDPDLRLIETLLWDGAGFPRLALHMARLRRSAGLLGWSGGEAEAALRGVSGAPARVRLTLDAGGACAVTVTALPPVAEVWRVGLAQGRLQSGDPWLSVKSTRRAAYDAARAALPGGLDEVIFVNERDEVCDGTITTVFFDRGQGMRTPPLSSGLLPGVLRAGMGCPEEVLPVADLPRLRLWVGNAVRGLIPAVWVG